MYGRMCPIGDVRGFRCFHPEMLVGLGRQNLPTKISELFTFKKVAKNDQKTASAGVG